MACKRPMKAKRSSAIAKGPRARAAVFSGKKVKTQTSLTKALYAEAKSRVLKRVPLLTACRRRHMLDVKASDSIDDIKAKIEEILGIPANRQEVELRRGDIHLRVEMRIFVSTLGGESIPLDVDALDRVESVCRMVARPFDRFNLYFNTRELLPDQILFDLGIVNGSTLTLVKRNRPE